ncbi:MAG: methylmalonyl-CoA epimerase [Planctomycetota bacterium]|nr:MAG: methylmalonyl-CoA epimerase [Planctomycetota bacterium]
MTARLHHVGIAVRDLEQARARWELALGAAAGPVEQVPEEGVRIAFIEAGQSRIELLEPLDEHGPVARFLARRGEGVHHLAFAVDDLAAALERLKAAGVQVLDEQPRVRGNGDRSIVFIHPRAMGGVLTELVEYHRQGAREG